ncbi:hypothetical protein UlMin_010006 [Ulmus minor]
MTTKVKGLLKGLRYISQIFDEKEEEIQIGFPTDVKHVAHIGWDGPSASSPSWMNDYKSSEATPAMNSVGELSSQAGIGAQDSISQNEVTRPRRQHSSGTSSQSKRDGTKSSRRRHSTDALAGTQAQDSSGSSRHSRRSQKNNGSDSPSQDQPGIPKGLRRKKGSTGGSTKSSRLSRSKGQNSLSEIQFLDLGPESESGHEGKNDEILAAEKG